MSFLQKLFGGQSAKPDKRYYTFSVKCRRCGEIIEGRGVAPDITVQRPLPYSSGADPVLNAAITELVKRPPRQAPVQPDPKGTSQ